MASRWSGRDQRRAPRIDVLMRVNGETSALETPILIHDLSRTGFAVISQIPFEPGQVLDFRLAADHEAPVSVTAQAVHSRPFGAAPGLNLTGFTFVPGRITGLVPHVLIDRLIAAVSGAPVPCL
jgi:hypothetical protein